MPVLSDSTELKLAVRTDIVGECLQVTALINNQKISSSVYYLQEQAIRDALIKLGWTPPDAATVTNSKPKPVPPPTTEYVGYRHYV